MDWNLCWICQKKHRVRPLSTNISKDKLDDYYKAAKIRNDSRSRHILQVWNSVALYGPKWHDICFNKYIDGNELGVIMAQEVDKTSDAIKVWYLVPFTLVTFRTCSVYNC